MPVFSSSQLVLVTPKDIHASVSKNGFIDIKDGPPQLHNNCTISVHLDAVDELIRQLALCKLDLTQPVQPDAEDEALQKLCQQLERMERRMENLETILTDKEERKEKQP
jgi:BMFP domain-containing protein YqiC